METMSRRPPLTLAALAVLSVAIGACSAAPLPPTAAPGSSQAPAPATPTPEPAPHQEQQPKGSLTALSVQQDIDIWKRWAPTARPTWTFDTRNPVGEQLAMLVTGERTDDAGIDWLRILLPIRPNEADGWVHAADVHLRPVQDRIVVDLSKRSLEHFHGSKLIDRFEVGIGQPQWPTATGTFYVWAHVPQASPTGPYGVFALGLSGFSEVLTDWPDGGRMAIHGTPYASNKGQMVSHGCIRVFNPDMQKLKRVPLGTPVIIKQ
jgi:lipoprotein-anchoring transpeptidase ErfK/SrfK